MYAKYKPFKISAHCGGSLCHTRLPPARQKSRHACATKREYRNSAPRGLARLNENSRSRSIRREIRPAGVKEDALTALLNTCLTSVAIKLKHFETIESRLSAELQLLSNLTAEALPSSSWAIEAPPSSSRTTEVPISNSWTAEESFSSNPAAEE